MRSKYRPNSVREPIGVASRIQSKLVSMASPLAASAFILASAGVFAAPTSPVKVGEGAVILKLRTLLAQRDDQSGVQILGVERSGTSPDGRLDAHVLYVHGMGWAENAGTLGDSWHLVRAIEHAYGVSGSVDTMPRMCGDSSHVGPVPPIGGIRFGRPKPPSQPQLEPYATDDPHSTVNLGSVACMDRVVVQIDAKHRVTIYRLLWDNLLYDAVLYPHIGYDDGIFGPFELPQLEGGATDKPLEGYENLHILRAPLTASVKNNMSSYGLSEAALYLGPLGETLRKTVASAMCVVADESEHKGTRFAALAEEHEKSTSVEEAYAGVDIDRECQSSSVSQLHPTFAVVTESLGSRVVFDAIARGDESGLARRFPRVGSTVAPEVFMLANQIPVLAPGELRKGAGTPSTEVKARLIAFNEINDVLTYELVPYFEHLYNMRCRPQADAQIAVAAECLARMSTPLQMAEHRALLSDPMARQNLARVVGFEVVDVRAKFASQSWLTDAVDPLVAHGGYLDQPDLVRLMLCGVKDGRVLGAADGCSSH